MRRYFTKLLQPGTWCLMGAAVALGVSTASAQNFDVLLENKKVMEQLKVGPKDWPQWAGTPYRNNVVEAANIPTKWDGAAGTNIVWKSPIPKHGYNSPVIWGDKIFVSGSDKQTREVYCYNRLDGKLLWTGISDNIQGSPAAPPNRAPARSDRSRPGRSEACPTDPATPRRSGRWRYHP